MGFSAGAGKVAYFQPARTFFLRSSPRHAPTPTARDTHTIHLPLAVEVNRVATMSKEKSKQKKEPQKKQSASVKAMKYPQAPAPLMDLVTSFLNEHGYVDAARKLET